MLFPIAHIFPGVECLVTETNKICWEICHKMSCYSLLHLKLKGHVSLWNEGSDCEKCLGKLFSARSVPCHSGATCQVTIKEGYGSTFLTLRSRGWVRSSGRSIRKQIPCGSVTVVWHEWGAAFPILCADDVLQLLFVRCLCVADCPVFLWNSGDFLCGGCSDGLFFFRGTTTFRTTTTE